VVDLVLGPGPVASLEVPAHLFRLPLHRRLPALAQWAGAAAPTGTDPAAAARGLVAAAPAALGGGQGGGQGGGLGGGGGTSVPDDLFAALAGRPGSATEVATVNTALVSLLDHGLAASVVAARVAASARASAYDCLVAGLATLSGRLHGGIVPEAVALLRGTADVNPGERRAGFGHWRHPFGDPRAEAVLARLARVDAAGPVLERLEQLADRLERRPNIDGALAALVVACGLPDGAGEVCFQVGRTVGLAAHVAEEAAEEPLRWRARDPDA
jgi:citrate synthase